MAIAYRASASGNGTNSASVTIPASIEAGDSLLLFVEVNTDCTISTPSGWQVAKAQQQAEATGIVAAVFKRVALAGDASSSVTVTDDVAAGGKTVALLIAHSGTDRIDPVHAINSALYTPSQSSHATPSITTTVADCFIVEAGLTKNSSATTFSAVPSGSTSRISYIGSGGGHVDGAISNRGPSATGNYGGGTFVQDQNASSSICYTVALLPQSNTQTLRPQTDITTGSYAGVPTPGAGVALASRIGEPVRDDSTYIVSPNNPTNAIYEGRLAAGVDPLSSTGHVVTTVLGTGGGASSSTCVVSLVQGTTVIASGTFTSIPETPTVCSFTLTSGEANSITDYTNLRLRYDWTVA